MFEITVLSLSPPIVLISGKTGLVQLLKNKLTSTEHSSEYYYYTHYESSTESTIRFNQSDLTKTIGETRVIQLLVEFLEKFPIAMTSSMHSKYAMYILKYWQFEAEMIQENKSYRSYPGYGPLSQSYKIEKLLKECSKFEYLPAIENVFTLIEISDCIKAVYSSNRSLMARENQLSKIEIETFSRAAKLSNNEIKTCASLLSKGQKDTKSILSKLPKPICIEIASLVGNPAVHDHKATHSIANKYFKTNNVTLESKPAKTNNNEGLSFFPYLHHLFFENSCNSIAITENEVVVKVKDKSKLTKNILQFFTANPEVLPFNVGIADENNKISIKGCGEGAWW